MQEPGSPEVKKPAVMEKDSKEFAHLVSYSIVIDVKSTVWRQSFWITRSALCCAQTRYKGLLELQHCLWFQCVFMSLALDVKGSSVYVVKYQFFLSSFFSFNWLALMILITLALFHFTWILYCFLCTLCFPVLVNKILQIFFFFFSKFAVVFNLLPCACTTTNTCSDIVKMTDSLGCDFNYTPSALVIPLVD